MADRNKKKKEEKKTDNQDEQQDEVIITEEVINDNKPTEWDESFENICEDLIDESQLNTFLHQKSYRYFTKWSNEICYPVKNQCARRSVMIKKVKQYLAQHPRLRVLAIVGAGVAIIMIVFKAFSYTAPIDVSVPQSTINTTVGPMNQAAPKIEQQKIKAYTQLADTKKHMQAVSSGKTVLQDVFKDEDEPKKDVVVEKEAPQESAAVQKKSSSSIISKVKNLRSTASNSKTKKSSTYKSRLSSKAASQSKKYNDTNLQQKLQKIQYQLQNPPSTL